jgi:parallel beta-helix repeat protein
MNLREFQNRPFFSGHVGGRIFPNVFAANRVVNVNDLGALGDGETDCTAILQGAIDSLAGRGGVVYIPAGRYIVSESLVVHPDGVTVVGDGMGATIIQLADHIETFIFGIIRTPPGRITKYVTVRDLTLDGNRENQSEEQQEHQEQFGFYCGVTPDSPESDEDIACYRVEARNCTGYGFDPHEVVTRLYLIDCLSHHNGKDGITIDGCFNVIVRGCLTYANDRHGFNMVTNTRQCTFNNNLAFDNGANGFMIQNGSRENIFSNNTVYRNAADGIAVNNVPDNVLLNNYVYENGANGIRVRGCLRTTVVNNRLRNNSQAEHERYDEIHIGGFEGNGSLQCMITNNHITINGRLRSRYGIFEAPENDGATQEENMFANNKSYGAVRKDYRFDGEDSSVLVNV